MLCYGVVETELAVVREYAHDCRREALADAGCVVWLLRNGFDISRLSGGHIPMQVTAIGMDQQVPGVEIAIVFDGRLQSGFETGFGFLPIHNVRTYGFIGVKWL